MDTYVVVEVPQGAALSEDDLAFLQRAAQYVYHPDEQTFTLTAQCSVENTSPRPTVGVSTDELIEFARTHPQWVQWPKREDIVHNIATLEHHLARQYVLLTLVDESPE